MSRPVFIHGTDVTVVSREHVEREIAAITAELDAIESDTRDGTDINRQD